jgi:crotonobetainyl-CoA:carnitine CoA-transferase CaiB-like acyl-CoA transferase
MQTFNLACRGAYVKKVESHSHIDWWRVTRPPGDGDGMGLHERSHVFNTTNRGKRGITLDLATEGGRETLLDLVETADVLVENYAASVMEKLGLTWEALSARNPSLIMLRQPGYGADGPEAGYVVFGNTIEGMSGLSSLVGYEDGPPMMLSNACGDPVSGLGGTVALLAAVAARRRDGKGRLVECAQLEGFLPMVSEGLIEYQVTGVAPERRGNQRAEKHPSGAYHAGNDRWVALAVQDDEAWERLAGEIAEDWALEPSLALAGDRQQQRSLLSERLGTWIKAVGPDAAVEACLCARVPASAVLDESEVLGLDPLLASEFWQGLDRDPVGYHLHPTLAYSRAGRRPLAERPAPLLGQHTEEVLRALGKNSRELAALAAAGVTGPVPVSA